MKRWLLFPLLIALMHGYFSCVPAFAGQFELCGEYCHISNAGIELPNRGVDLLGPGMSVPLPFRLNIHLALGLGKQLVKNQFGATGSFERALRAGVSRSLIGPLYAKVEIGGYLAFGAGRRHSAWASALLGVSVTSRAGLKTFIAVGPTYLTHPDGTALSGNLQFNIQTGVCLVDFGG